jgi:hypothetical protein
MGGSDPICFIEGEIEVPMEFQEFDFSALFNEAIVAVKNAPLDSEQDEAPTLHKMEEDVVDFKQDEAPTLYNMEEDVVDSEQDEAPTLYNMAEVSMHSSKIELAGDFGVNAVYGSEPISS